MSKWRAPRPEHDRSRRSHPDVIATSLAHDRRPRGTCASDDRENPGACNCQPDQADLAEVWAGRARMAAARRAAGQPLDPIDHQALAMQETT